MAELGRGCIVQGVVTLKKKTNISAADVTFVDLSNGYVYKMQVYTGKNVESTETDVGLCSRVVLDLMSGLEDKGLDLYTDNYYTSPKLYLELFNRGVNSKTGRERGFYDYRSKGPLLATVWFDRRFFYFLSTMHVAEDSSTPTTVLRHQPDGSQLSVRCPPLLIDYQQYMRHVDRWDQMVARAKDDVINRGELSRSSANRV